MDYMCGGMNRLYHTLTNWPRAGLVASPYRDSCSSILARPATDPPMKARADNNKKLR